MVGIAPQRVVLASRIRVVMTDEAATRILRNVEIVPPPAYILCPDSLDSPLLTVWLLS